MKAIYLTGFMGAGKTTIGRELAAKMALPVYDTDQQIEEREGKTIAAIFAEDGERHFRDLETEMLKRLPKEDCIITTGGGIILKEENRKWMKANGLSIYLHCDPDEIAKRLEDDQTRPLLNGERKKELHQLFDSRLPLYQEAEWTLETTGKTVSDTVNEVVRRIK